MKYRRAQRAAWRAIDDEMIVLDLETRRMYGFNKSAAFLWQTLESMEDFATMLRAMAGEGNDLQPFSADALSAFCEELVELDLLEREEPEEGEPVAIEPPTEVEPPRILWQETLAMVGASCAFFPGTSALCNQVPFS